MSDNVMVPREATTEMQVAGLTALDGSKSSAEGIGSMVGYQAIRELWSAMLAASPAPASGLTKDEREALECFDEDELNAIARALRADGPANNIRTIVAALRRLAAAPGGGDLSDADLMDAEKMLAQLPNDIREAERAIRHRFYMQGMADARAISKPTAIAGEGGVDGVSLIAAERKRQVEAEGWTPEHDDEHDTSELAQAAAVYAAPHPRNRIMDLWPWHYTWWKPGPTRERELVKAGALIAAELDRLQRKSAAISATAPGEGKDG